MGKHHSLIITITLGKTFTLTHTPLTCCNSNNNHNRGECYVNSKKKSLTIFVGRKENVVGVVENKLLLRNNCATIGKCCVFINGWVKAPAWRECQSLHNCYTVMCAKRGRKFFGEISSEMQFSDNCIYISTYRWDYCLLILQ